MKNIEKKTPKIKDILNLLIKGAVLSSLFLFPGAGLGIAAIYNEYEKLKSEKDLQEWQKYDSNRLKYALQRLRRQKYIETKEIDGSSVIKITEKGKIRVLKYKLEEMTIFKPTKWDKKWRLIIYDISKFKRQQQDAFRRFLKKLKMLRLQKSVYLTPYPCENEIEFLRQYFDIGEAVIYLVVEKIEDEDLYKRYFHL